MSYGLHVNARMHKHTCTTAYQYNAYNNMFWGTVDTTYSKTMPENKQPRAKWKYRLERMHDKAFLIPPRHQNVPAPLHPPVQC